MRSGRSLILVAFLVTVLAGVITSGTSADRRARSAGASVTVRPSRYGRILFDGRGFVLYSFTHDLRRRATCYGACATRWPPFLVMKRPATRTGAQAVLVGTTRRRDGRLQVTYAGRPLYYYRGDNAPGIILCQNVSEFGGLWLVVRPSGKPVR